MSENMQTQEPKEVRTLEEIQAEYVEVCKQAGELQYHIEVMKADLLKFNQRLLQLNEEAASVKSLLPNQEQMNG
jgi:hypothetical protein